MHAVTFLALSLPLAAPALKDKGLRHASLVGDWVAVRLVNNGTEDGSPHSVRYGFTADGRWPGTRDGTALPGPSRAYALDPKANPPAIDLTFDPTMGDRGRLLGVYELKGDTLTICMGNAGQPRPAAFEPGDGRTLIVLKRVKKD
jgi:uncharacterized protein (TIGR03067 family)